MAINALSGQDHVLEPSAAKHILICLAAKGQSALL